MNVFQIQLPTVDNDGNGVDVASVILDIVGIAGGATVSDAQGFWRDDSGKLFVDTVKNVQTFCDDAQLSRLRISVEGWRVQLKQYALVYSAWSADVQFVEGSL